jgi:hypothetical protein
MEMGSKVAASRTGLCLLAQPDRVMRRRGSCGMLRGIMDGHNEDNLLVVLAFCALGLLISGWSPPFQDCAVAEAAGLISR